MSVFVVTVVTLTNYLICAGIGVYTAIASKSWETLRLDKIKVYWAFSWFVAHLSLLPLIILQTTPRCIISAYILLFGCLVLCCVLNCKVSSFIKAANKHD